MRILTFIIVFAASASTAVAQTAGSPDPATLPQGSIVGWGSHVVGVNLSQGFIEVAAGWYHNLGLKADGSIMAWGDNSLGQCNVPSPNMGFVRVAAGRFHNLGVKADGSIVAWGGCERVPFGQCNVPAPNTGFVAVAAGEAHSLALTLNGSVVAWGCGGTENYGQCDVPSPNTGFIAVAAGPFHSLALRGDGSIVAWGWNGYGQTNIPSPNTGFVGVAGGWYHSLGLKANGSIVAWGGNGDGQRNIPSPNTGFVRVGAGHYHSLGIKADGSVVAWGRNDYGQTTVPSPNMGFVRVAGGASHSVGLKADGSIVAWGCDGPLPSQGQCNVPGPIVGVAAGFYHSLALRGDGSIEAWGSNSSNVPAPNADFIGIAGGENHSLGLKSDGSIVAWGRNDSGQANVPSPNTGFIAVAAGENHSLGLKADGSIVAWGDNTNGLTTVPAPNTGFTDVAAGGWHSIGLKRDGSIVAWGCGSPNYYGQCSVPQPNTGFVAIAGGWYHTLAVRADGSIAVWGTNFFGQAIAPSPNAGFVRVAAGEAHSLALKADGSIVAWGCGGDSDYGQCNVPSPNADFVDLAAGGIQSLAIRANSVLRVAPSHVLGSYSAGLASVAISKLGFRTMPWSGAVAPGSPWLRITSGASGVNGGIIFVAYDANPDPGPRTGTIRVSAPGASPPSVDVSVVQSGTAPPPQVTHFEFAPLPGPYLINEPIPVTITAMNATNTAAAPAVQSGFSGRVDLSASTGALVSPRFVDIANGVWTGSLKVDLPAPETTLTARSGQIRGSTPPFLVGTLIPFPGCVSGRVVMGSGNVSPVNGAVVRLQRPEGTPLGQVTTPTLCTLPASLGEYCFCGLEPGTYQLVAEKGVQRTLPQGVSLLPGKGVVRNLPLGDSQKLPVLLVGGMMGSTMSGTRTNYPTLDEEDYPKDLILHDPAVCGGILFDSDNPVWGTLRKTLAPLFTIVDVPWDWRQKIDEKLVRKYLIPKIEEAKKRCDPPCQKVRIVAHSAGGILVRRYMQDASLYQHDIERFTMCGTPNRGGAIAYYVWEYGDIRTPDDIQNKNQQTFVERLCTPDDFYTNTVRNLFEASGEVWSTGNYAESTPSGAPPTADRIKEFIQGHAPGLSDFLPTYPFVIEGSNIKPRPDYQTSVLWQLENVWSRIVLTDDVRTKLFAGVMGPTVVEISLDSKQPRYSVGDGTVPLRSAWGGLTGQVSMDYSKAAGHSRIMYEYASEICQFLNNDVPCPTSQVSGGEPALTSLLNVSIAGRVQPFLSNPAGLSSGIDPTTTELVQTMPGSEVEVIPGHARLSVTDPVNGSYTLEISALAEEVFTVDFDFSNAEGTESLRASAIYHDTPVVFTVELDPVASPAMLLIPAVEPPANVRVENVSGMTKLAWDASPDAAVTGYNIYARPDAEPKFTLFGTTTATTFETGHAFSIGGSASAWRYFVLATVADGAESPFVAVLENRHRLVARLAADVTTGLEPLTVTFADQSSGEVSAWAWDFESDGTIDSTAQNPTHVYETPGSYTVTLTVGGPEGTDTAIRAGFITVDPLIPLPPTVPGDFDADGDVDLTDWAAFKVRMNGPYVDPTVAGWYLFDLDPDYDVDLHDLAVWQNVFTGP